MSPRRPPSRRSLLPLAGATLALALLAAGCASAGEEPAHVEETNQELVAPSCAPALASGAVPKMHRAMLDTVAFTEGTAGTCGQDGYNTGFAFHCFSSCGSHPRKVWTSGRYASSAAGRYQFLTKTWATMDADDFGPKAQDRAAMELIERRGVSLPEGRPLGATDFTNAMKKMSYEWASLPYSPYGQPRRSLTQTRAKYCERAGC